MGRKHPSTPAERVQWVSHMLAHPGEYGLVTRLADSLGVSRPTLYAWKAQATLALEQAFLGTTTASVVGTTLERQILTLLIEGHNSYANIQSCLRALTGQHLSIGTIAAIVAEAQRRALDWMACHAPTSPRSLALDEIYANNRQGAYLNVVDTDSWAVWAAEGPLPVDAESWTLLLWLAQERGLKWYTTVSDGGDALRSACQTVDPDGQHARDHWHVFHTFSQGQHRLARRLRALQERTPTVERQAARLAAGLKPRGGKPRTDLQAHLAEINEMERTFKELQSLGHILREVLAVIVLDREGLMDAPHRQQELEALLELLKELHLRAPSTVQAELKRLHTHLRLAQGALLTFVARLDSVHEAISAVVGLDGLALVGWAWLRRKVLGWDREQLVARLPQAWRAGARVLIQAWERATRASSAVENWHSIVRPHLAVHRSLSPGMLALLAVWHNHRIFTRGVHKGHSPLHLSGMLEAPSDWLVALGYPPALTDTMPTSASLNELALAA
jgi:hypothetical protein